MRKALLLGAGVGALIAGYALYAGGIGQPEAYRLASQTGGTHVAIWRSGARAEGEKLLALGVTEVAVLQTVIACVAPNGTAVVTTSWGIWSRDVIVREGEFAGCKGEVATETLIAKVTMEDAWGQ